MVGLAVQSRALGAEIPVCAPPDEEFAELLAMSLAPVGQPMRPPVTRATPPSAADLPRRAGELTAAQSDTVAAAAEECDAPVATGVMPTGVWR
jgi:vancomycin aglycone glucosyltransferase